MSWERIRISFFKLMLSPGCWLSRLKGIRLKKINTEIFHAISDGSEDRVVKLIHAGADVNYQHFRQPLLNMAIFEGKIEIALILVKAGAKVTSLSSNFYMSFSPLELTASTHSITEDNRAKLLNLMLDYTTQIDAVNSYGFTALTVAIESRCKAAAMILLSRGASVKVGNSDNGDALHVLKKLKTISFWGENLAIENLENMKLFAAIELANLNTITCKASDEEIKLPDHIQPKRMRL